MKREEVKIDVKVVGVFNSFSGEKKVGVITKTDHASLEFGCCDVYHGGAWVSFMRYADMEVYTGSEPVGTVISQGPTIDPIDHFTRRR